MHPDVCRFISKAVYEGQLESEPSTWRQALVLKNQPDPVLSATGIRFEAVSHQGCSQRSREEAERVKANYLSLLQQCYRDTEGHEHPITPADILVLSPWNMQVNLLKHLLPDGARVGTVDKFQPGHGRHPGGLHYPVAGFRALPSWGRIMRRRLLPAPRNFPKAGCF
jgi:uncharacterized protein